MVKLTNALFCASARSSSRRIFWRRLMSEERSARRLSSMTRTVSGHVDSRLSAWLSTEVARRSEQPKSDNTTDRSM
ncbi:MAG: hypothetical protein UHZ01_02330, partial [Prevotella sp.]|nr:hypothetical protein [Prevotella sp.]